MASSSVPTVSKKAPKKNIKRIMLARTEEKITEIDKDAQNAIKAAVCSYVGTFKNRKDLDRAFMLGYNNISRKVEQCDENLKIVLLNSRAKPDLVINHLYKLCEQKKVPVCRLDNFEAMREALLPLVKGLKPTFLALGILDGSTEDFRAGIIGRLPSIDIPDEPPVVKRAKFSPPPVPMVDVDQFYLKNSDFPAMSSSQELPSTSAETLSFSEGSIPIVTYGESIGSARPISSLRIANVDKKQQKQSSKYRALVMESR